MITHDKLEFRKFISNDHVEPVLFVDFQLYLSNLEFNFKVLNFIHFDLVSPYEIILVRI